MEHTTLDLERNAERESAGNPSDDLRTRLSEAELLRDEGIQERIQRSVPGEDTKRQLAVESLVHLLKTYNIVHEQIGTLLASHDLSLAKLNLLVVLGNAPDHRLPMSEIGGRMSVTCANITKLVDGLEKDGLARRASQPGDRRVVLTELTDAGKALLAKVLPDHFENVERLWSGLDEQDCLRMIHLMIKLRHGIEAHRVSQPEK